MYFSKCRIVHNGPFSNYLIFSFVLFFLRGWLSDKRNVWTCKLISDFKIFQSFYFHCFFLAHSRIDSEFLGICEWCWMQSWSFWVVNVDFSTELLLSVWFDQFFWGLVNCFLRQIRVMTFVIQLLCHITSVSYSSKLPSQGRNQDFWRGLPGHPIYSPLPLHLKCWKVWVNDS